MIHSAICAAANYTPMIILGVFFVLMIVMTIIPQKKRQKKTQEMMDNLAVGDKVMTIGRMVGTIRLIDNENARITLDVGTGDSETLVVFDRNAIGYVIDGQYKPEEKPKRENKGILSKKRGDADDISEAPADAGSPDAAEESSSPAEDTSDIKIDKDEDLKF